MYRIILILACLFVIPAMGGAQETRPASANSESADYPDSSEGVRQFLNDAVAAVKSGNEERVAALIRRMEIPDYQHWFDKVFGPSDGATLTITYRDHRETDRENFLDNLKRLVQNYGELVIDRVEDMPVPDEGRINKALRESLKQPVAFYSAAWRRPLPPSSYSNNPLGFFTLIDGSFRRMPFPLVYELSAAHGMSLRIRQGGNVQSKLLVQKVPPRYPLGARSSGVQGVVRLNVIVAKNGTISEIKVMSGDPLLAEAAIEAVRQWRYRPTLLNGWPVEVDTTIDVIFSLNR